MGSMDAESTDFDVVIIGAGISGINAGYRIQHELPGYTYAILEARGAMGGTWDLFKYPGIRSDSDLYTFGFPWRPWSYSKVIADGALIKQYITESAAEFGIDKHIQYHHKLVSADWSSEAQNWFFTVDAAGQEKEIRGRFVIFASGYYDYEQPLDVKIPGIENFNGTRIHPQFWPEDLDYAGKKIVIIGSGATAVTLLPNLTEKAASVTMLQRSPTYVLAQPSVDPVSVALNKILPTAVARQLVRLKFLILPWIFFNFCRAYPKVVIKIIKSATEKQLPSSIAQDPNFKPNYNPWEQRLCVCPDGDFYTALREGKGHVVTDTIKNVTSTGILTSSGTTLEADIIVTATGLKMRLAGGARVTVDGTLIRFSEKFMWKGSMIQDVPNAAVVIGYTNASWTLGAEATAQLVCRILRHMKNKGMACVVPRVANESKLTAVNLMNLKSTYIVEAKGTLPKGGNTGPWQPRSSYFRDLWNAKFGGLNELVFETSHKKFD